MIDDDMILYLEDPKNHTRKILDLMNKCSKIVGYKLTSVTQLHKNKQFMVTEAVLLNIVKTILHIKKVDSDIEHVN